jgi:hypothetical protein
MSSPDVDLGPPGDLAPTSELEPQGNLAATSDWDTPADLAALWAHAREQLENELTQQAFIEACVLRQNIAYAAKCYRTLSEEALAQGSPRRRELAELQLGKLQAVAFRVLKSSATPPPQFKKVATLVAVTICALLLLTVALALKS